MVNSLRKVDFSHPTGHYKWEKFSDPLEKILGAPLFGPCFVFYRTGFTADDLRRTTSACYHLGYCYVLVDRVISLNVKKPL